MFNALPGRLCIGAMAPRMVSAPLTRPEAPIPAIALPIISMFEDRAAPQIIEPNSKRPRKEMKVIYGKSAHKAEIEA
jgi:hypothetical protein